MNGYILRLQKSLYTINIHAKMSLVAQKKHTAATLVSLSKIWIKGFIYKVNTLLLLPQIHQLNMEQNTKKVFFISTSVQCPDCGEDMAARSLAVNRQNQNGMDAGGRQQCETSAQTAPVFR